MLGVGKNITLSLGIPNQVIAENFVLRKDFHSIQLTCADLSYQVNLSERATSKQFQGHEVIWADPANSLLLC